MNDAVMNVHVHVFLWTYVLFIVGRLLGVELQAHIVNSCLSFYEIGKLFSLVWYLFIFPSAMYEGSDLSTSSPTFVIVCLFVFNHSHSSGYLIVILICIFPND